MKRPQAIVRAQLAFKVSLRAGAATVVLVSLLSMTAPARAQNKFWVNSGGGTFGATTNWSATAGGASGAAPPAAGENANFTLGSTYTVGFGTSVTNAGLLVSNGTVTLDLNSFTYTITTSAGAQIGANTSQTGRLAVRDGILAVDTAGDDLVVGAPASATGLLTITTNGRLGNGTLDPDLIVGSLGTGTLAVEDNGRADLGLLNIGQGEGSTGTATVTGPNAMIDTSGGVNVGISSSGTLTLQNGGSMQTAGTAIVGNSVGADGTVTVNGSFAKWTQAGAFTIADAGDGGLTIQSTGSVSTAGPVTIGNAATGVGAAIVTGTDSSWEMGSTLNVGNNGFGNVAVTSGGRMSTNGLTNIANGSTGEGNVIVTGAGSRWTTGAINVGNNGTGVLTIAGGGLTNTTGNVTLASAATSSGRATVTGIGSAWNIAGSLTVANLGTGNLTVETGGTLSATGALVLNDPAGAANGTFNFQGGTVSANSFLRSATSLFNWTDGTLLVNSGTFSNGGANLTINGADADDLPALRLSSGAQSTLANLPNLTIGGNRQGAAIVSGGSSIHTTTASIGSQDGGSGTLLVEGVGSVFSTSGGLGVGGTSLAAGGIGTLTIGAAGTVTAGGTLQLWNGGTININGGTLSFSNIVPNGGRMNFVAGVVQVSSNFAANAANLNAILGASRVLGPGRRIDVPGNTLNLQADLTVDGGSVTGGVLSIGSSVITRVGLGGSMAFTGGITNPAGARMFVTDGSVSAGSTYTNAGELNLAGSTATVSAASLFNAGLITGTGRINNVVTNNAAGQIRVASGQRLEILGGANANLNDGLIDISGGTIEFGRTIVNGTVSPSTGMIAARNATLRFQSGLLNSGALTFTDGVSDVFGDVTNQNNLTTPGRIVVTGGAQANFFDDIVNNGTIQVSAAGNLQSTAVFLGSLSGNGVGGDGHVFIEGDARPGFSPGLMEFGGDVSFGPLAALEIELAGTVLGTQYDRVTVASTASLGGTLDVSLLGGFRPLGGSLFTILTAANIVGTFDSEALPALSGGLSFDVLYAPQSVTLAVAGVLGDYNFNGTVDAADFAVWRSLLDSDSPAADGSGNGVVDQADYDVWRANFGKVAVTPAGAGSGTPMVVAVPEPSTVVLAGMFALASFIVSRRKRR
jgi:T5SS/PEP-CTERM-associated repeat protein